MSKVDASRMDICFTVHTGNQGFTDQMMQFSAFYKLGLALGYGYIYTPFISLRSMPLNNNTDIAEVNPLPNASGEFFRQVDIYDYLGFNQRFNTSEFCLNNENVEVLEVELSDRIVEENDVSSFADLKNYVQKFIANKRKTNKKLKIILRLDRIKPVEGKGKRQFFSLIHTAFPHFPDGLDFRSLYFDTRKNDPISSLFEDNKIKLVVHIRQGDTGFIETPWNTFIPVDSRRPDCLTEQIDFEKIKSSHSNNFVDSLFQPIDYSDFMVKLCSYFTENIFSTLVFSDGYERAFDIINKNMTRLKLDAEKSAVLNKMRSSYDKAQFEMFNNIKGTKCIIGETQDKLHKLIHSTLTSDIVIVAAQQRMLPKLSANFCVSDAPIIIVLYRTNIPDYSDVVQNDDERYIYTDIDNPDMSKIVERVGRLITKNFI
jgi:hypothetical protein